MMTPVDYVVLLLYVAGIVGVGVYFATKVRNSGDMFAAGGKSPWWVSGLSAFMTMFSAGTFVVWGGVAYRYGLVAVTISLCYGVAALAVGWTVAGLWKRLGVASAAEFLERRYGRGLVQLYTWLQGLLVLFASSGVALFSLSIIIAELVALPAGMEAGPLAFLRDDDTGSISVGWCIGIIMIIVVAITMTGGLWAVLVTDVLQFIVLTASVLVVVPLILMRVGGVGGFIESGSALVVDGRGSTLLSPVSADYTWWFIVGWVIVHYAKIGGEWAFVQRFVCVPTPKDARRSTWAFGVMYLVSPLFWMLPPIAYRLIHPISEGMPAAEVKTLANSAYISACVEVLPAGMIGLMLAAMISATASTATTQLNVYAAAFTQEFYRRFIEPLATERRLVLVGRVFTVLLGLVMLAGALTVAVGRQGDATGFIIEVTNAMTIPLTLPTLWGLISRRVGLLGAWVATVVGAGASIIARFGFQGDDAWFAGVSALAWAVDLANQNTAVTGWIVGLSVPLVTLLGFELFSKGEAPGYARSRELQRSAERAGVSAPAEAESSLAPAFISGWTVVVLAGLAGVIALLPSAGPGAAPTLGVFAGMLGLIGGIILLNAAGADRRRRAANVASAVANHSR